MLTLSKLAIAKAICSEVLRDGFTYWWAPDEERLEVVEELIGRGVIKFRDESFRGERYIVQAQNMQAFLRELAV